MRLREYRIVLPLSVEECCGVEFHRGQLWTCAEASLEETGGGEGVEVLETRSFEDFALLNGQYNNGKYTKKIYHLKKKIPVWLRWAIPDGATRVYEEAWNAYPYCKTVLTNPEYMKEKFEIIIESMHINDRGESDNALELTGERLERRKKEGIQVIDIRGDKHLEKGDIKPTTDPKKFRSQVTGRGPLREGWMREVDPVMCCYKVVSVHIDLVLQNKVEKFSHKQYLRLFSKFHREVFCFIDKWHNLTIQEIREKEQEISKQLSEKRQKGKVQGMVC